MDEAPNNPSAAARCNRVRSAGAADRRGGGGVLPECGEPAAHRFRRGSSPNSRRCIRGPAAAVQADRYHWRRSAACQRDCQDHRPVPHRAVGFAEAVLAVALLGVLARLPLLTLLAALALSHAALGKLLLQLLEPIAQAFLILLQIAHALIALLAAHAITPRILTLLEGLVAQLLLLADHVAKLVQRLLHVAVTLAGLRHLQVFQHLLQLFEQLPGGVLVAGAR